MSSAARGAHTPEGKAPLSVFILALDEADRLPRCLRSVSWAQEVVVVDAGSRDNTVGVAREAGARVIPHPWEGYSRQKEFALEQCHEEWVLWLDADEEVSPRLAQEIRRSLADPASACGFAVARRTVYLGKALRFGGWYPDWKVRLFRRDRVRFDGREVHETAIVEGQVRRLRGDLLHHSYRNLAHHLEKIDAYSALWAGQRAGHVRPRLRDLLLRPPAKFLKAYVLRLGFLEGWRGLAVAYLGALYVAMKYARLFELERRRPGAE